MVELTFDQILGKLLGGATSVAFLDLERDLGFDFVLFDVTRTENGAGEEHVHVDTVEFELGLERLS